MTNDGRMVALADQLAAGRLDAGSLGPLVPGSNETLYRLEVAGAAAVSTWERVRAQVNATGFWPVIMGSEADFERWRGEVTWEWGPSDTMRDMTTPVEAMLAESRSIEPLAWLRARVARDPEYYEPPHGAWPRNARRIDEYAIPFDLRADRVHDRVVIGLVPTTLPWEAPAHLRLGGWNECPTPAEHVAILKWWHERYGAELVGVTFDTVELRVERPPAEREEAMQLAWEHYVYCADTVQQGTNTIERLAAMLIGSPVWSFWWD